MPRRTEMLQKDAAGAGMRRLRLRSHFTSFRHKIIYLRYLYVYSIFNHQGSVSSLVTEIFKDETYEQCHI